jgi:hypothetical protein
VVDLRNTLAHARIYSPIDQPPFRLVRFGKPDGGLVEVLRVVDNLGRKWFDAQAALGRRRDQEGVLAIDVERSRCGSEGARRVALYTYRSQSS